MSKHNLIHLFPDFDCVSLRSEGVAPTSEIAPGAAPNASPGAAGAKALSEGESADEGIIRAGLLYISGDLGELAKIASPERAAELTALSQLMRALAAS